MALEAIFRNDHSIHFDFRNVKILNHISSCLNIGAILIAYKSPLSITSAIVVLNFVLTWVSVELVLARKFECTSTNADVTVFCHFAILTIPWTLLTLLTLVLTLADILIRPAAELILVLFLLHFQSSSPSHL